MAYSLLGLLDVNTPLLYGEGEKAFWRLQKEIIENSDDDSIFAWKASHASYATLCGLLARSPDEFNGSANMQPLETNNFGEFRMTQNGVRGAWLSIVPLSEHSEAAILLNTRTNKGRMIVTLAYLGMDKTGVPIMARVDPRTLQSVDFGHINQSTTAARD